VSFLNHLVYYNTFTDIDFALCKAGRRHVSTDNSKHTKCVGVYMLGQASHRKLPASHDMEQTHQTLCDGDWNMLTEPLLLERLSSAACG
jgi:hypothetical protein